MRKRPWLLPGLCVMLIGAIVIATHAGSAKLLFWAGVAAFVAGAGLLTAAEVGRRRL